MIVSAQISGAKWCCSATSHWYRDLLPSAICLCGKERLRQRTDYQPMQFTKVKTRKRKKRRKK